ncbi:hypothetical protein [Nocardia sp. NBC_00511]|uniref:hypothetical protein n=1 Tax=Nocardia sp. NBC_00511 TaxID=2903591 RepID=UPI0030E4655D
MGYDMLHVVRMWPEMAPNLLQLIVDFARGLQVSALIVPDLAHVDHRPGPVCDHVDLITINPPETWARAYEPADDTCQPAPDLAPLPESFLQPFLVPLPGGHTNPGGSMGRTEAHRIMQEHKGCRAVRCPRKAAALTELVDCGAMVPATVSPAQRAARRGLTVDRAVDLPTLHATLTALRQL